MINTSSNMNISQVLLLVLALFLAMTCSVKSRRGCITSSCGEVRNINYPFRLKGDPRGCGDSKYELTCEDNHTILHLDDGRYYVQSIDYTTQQIRLVDDGLQKDNCSSLPHHPWELLKIKEDPSIPYSRGSEDTLIILNCSKPISSPLYITAGSCIKERHAFNTSSNWNLYALVNPKALHIKDFCTIHSWTWVYDFGGELQINTSTYNYSLIHDIMADGFDVNFGVYSGSGIKVFLCYFDFLSIYNGFTGCRTVRRDSLYFAIWTPFESTALLVYFCAAKFVIGAPLVAMFLIYKYRRRHLAMDKKVEEFLQAHNNFLPIRYSFSNVKKITRNFKHKLGEGGYGSVYRGTLQSGNEVAIKVLKKSKANGQDFISEVATIGRIHHVNIVQLIGYCFEGSKQALVYDLMPNGSLDKHIFTKECDKFLDYRKIYEIALGVARGIEYLHRGCDMQILHFDIKPHNILLDKNFTPKVSDFGLAKLYPIDNNIVSMTAARGTLGYMAPELFYKNIGGVSYKSDVYSFGMLLMEMAGRRKNINANAERSSQVYFPLWVYDQVSEGESVEMEEVVQEEREVIKKMIIVALWCIQLNPNHRPPMNKVLEMLEGDIGNIQVPPKPLIYPPDEPIDDSKAEMELGTFSTSSSTPTISANFPFGDSSDV